MAGLNKHTIEAIFDLPDVMGSYPATQFAYLREISAGRRLVFLAFGGKCAGTFLRTAIVYALDGQLLRLVHAQGGRDFQPYMPSFLAYYLGNPKQKVGVTHAHMMALPANCRFIEAFDIRPVIVRRSIPDMLVSFSDMLDVDPIARVNGLNCEVPSDWLKLEQSRKADFVIDVFGPWYVNFFATWKSYMKEARDQVLVLDFDEIKNNPLAAVEKAITHSRLPFDRKRAEEGLEKAWNKRDELRFNKGETGRGGAFFTEEQLGRLSRLLNYYPQLGEWRGVLMGGTATGAVKAA
ncbi:MAG: hypothetical protein WAW96_07620 [Alphaproteobacteria bacterium]